MFPGVHLKQHEVMCIEQQVEVLLKIDENAEDAESTDQGVILWLNSCALR
jgi:hypothetical protein